MGSLFVLIKERFNLAVYLPTVAVLVAAMALYAQEIQQEGFPLARALIVFSLFVLFFLRMRFFDEIKDYEVDLKINPTRPLARGIISCKELKVYILAVIVLELGIVSFLGWDAFFLYAFAMFYSLLMYVEFFVGDFLRPHLTTYAITHTFVIFIMSLAALSILTETHVSEMSLRTLSFCAGNWMIFNLFEFARKTFSPEEERPQVDSYSSLFGVGGAWMLSISQAVLGSLFVFYSLNSLTVAGLTLIYILCTLGLIIKKNTAQAKFFRNISAAFLLVYYLAIAVELGV